MPKSHPPSPESKIAIVNRRRGPRPEFLRWQDLGGEARKPWELNEEYIRAGAGRVTKAGLCMGIDEGIICKKNAKGEGTVWCRRHRHQGPWKPTRTKPSGIPSEKRKLSNLQVKHLRTKRYSAPRKWTYKRLAEHYNVSKSTAAYACQHKTYRF